jgi:hypothetical protein
VTGGVPVGPAGRPGSDTPSTAMAIGCAVLFLLPFAVGGVIAAGGAAHAAALHDWTRAGFLGLFALVFGGVGIGGIVFVMRGRRAAQAATEREARFPDAPWLWREDWAARRITDGARTEIGFSWAFAIFWNLVSIPAAVLGVRAAMHAGNRGALAALLFPAVGIGLLIWALRATLRLRRYGTSVLELKTLPAVVGHVLEGTVRTPAGLRPAEGFWVTLTCVRRVTSGSGRNRSTSESIVWQDEHRTEAGGVGIPIAFAIPPDATPSDPQRGQDRTLWRLEVSAEVPGIDYSATFEVPVFRTAASALPRNTAELAVAAQSAIPVDYRQPSSSRIRLSQTRRGTEIYYPPARNPGLAIGLTVFTAIWVGAIWATLFFHAPLIFPIFFGAFGLLLLIIVLDQWLGVTRVLAGRDGVTVAKGLIVPYRERTLRPSEVAEVTTRIGTQAGRSAYYDITIVTTAGKHVTAGDGIHDKHEAEWLAAAVQSALRSD